MTERGRIDRAAISGERSIDSGGVSMDSFHLPCTCIDRNDLALIQMIVSCPLLGYTNMIPTYLGGVLYIH